MRYALLLAAPLLIAAAGDMNVATFLQKADALKAKGPLALLSSDLGLLKREFEGSGRYYRAQLEAEKRAGRQPSSCPPAKASMTSDEILADLRRVPPAERARTPVKHAFASMMARRFPCRR